MLLDIVNDNRGDQVADRHVVGNKQPNLGRGDVVANELLDLVNIVPV